jgi:hypothetical protein
MRKARAPLLAALDVEMSRAFKDGARQEEIEARRQALRDVTATRAPASASVRAIASPIPWLAPVTTAISPSMRTLTGPDGRSVIRNCRSTI